MALFFFHFKGIKRISPSRPTSKPDSPKKPLDSKGVVEFQFNTYLEMQGVDKKMMGNSK